MPLKLRKCPKLRLTLFAASSLMLSTFSHAGSNTNWNRVNFGNGYFSKCWDLAETFGTTPNGNMYRSWSKQNNKVTRFTADYLIKNKRFNGQTISANAIPDLSREFFRSTGGWPTLSDWETNYTVSWTAPVNGQHSYPGSGSGFYHYHFGLKFTISPQNSWLPYWNGSRECYVIHHSPYNANNWENFLNVMNDNSRPGPETRNVYLGNLTTSNGVSYKCWAREDVRKSEKSTTGERFWQLYAIRSSKTWSGNVKVKEIINYWKNRTRNLDVGDYLQPAGNNSKKGLLDGTMYMSWISIMNEAFAVDGKFELDNISIPVPSGISGGNSLPTGWVTIKSDAGNTNIHATAKTNWSRVNEHTRQQTWAQQKFKLIPYQGRYQIKNRWITSGTSLCLAEKESDHKIYSANYDQSLVKQWNIISIGAGKYQIKNQKTGRALEATGNSGTHLRTQGSNTNRSGQKWSFQNVN